MKILFVAYDSAFNQQLTRALVRNNCEIERVSDREVFIGPWRFTGAIWSLLRKVPFLKRINNRRFNAFVLKKAINEGFDALLATKGTTLKKYMLDALRDAGIVTVLWFPENVQRPEYRNWFAKHYKHYSVVYSFDPSVPEQFVSTSATRVTYLPFGIESVRAFPQEMPDYEVSFVGAWYPEREALLAHLIEQGIMVRIYGWQQWKKSSLAEHYCGPLAFEEMLDVFARSKININMNVYPRNPGANNRTFEIPAAGGFQLSDDQDALADLFEVGKEIAVYRNSSEAVERIRYYLSHEDERASIARAGYERVRAHHTLDARVRTIVADISQ